MTLTELFQHFFLLYGKRNRIFLSSLLQRIGFLNLALGDLEDAVRKGYDGKIIGIALARVFSRIACVAEQFTDLPLTRAMARKYPADCCSYCRTFPCSCAERRAQPALRVEPLEQQHLWSLRMWQDHLGALYGEKNRARGVENVLNRLFKEVCELLVLDMQLARLTASRTEIEEAFALELADALSWTIAAAHVLEVDLEAAVLARFGHGCWKCQALPCLCTHFSVDQVDWSTVST